VPDLAREDFAVFDDGKPQELTVFSNEVLPITVVVMLDTSGSMTGNMNVLKAGAEQFFLRLLRKDRARLGCFNDKIQFVSPMTGDRDELIASVQEVDFGYPTRLYDAIGAGLDELKESKAAASSWSSPTATTRPAGSGSIRCWTALRSKRSWSTQSASRARR